MSKSAFSSQTALVYDGGLYPFTALALTKGFRKVYYYSPYNSDTFPLSRKALWGFGLPGVERTNDFFEHVDEADVIIFPDIGMGDLQSYLKAKGKAVWGSGDAEFLEQDRVALKRWQVQNDLPTPRHWFIKGMDRLREHLMNPENDNQYIKIGEWRGDFESQHHKNYWLSEPWIDKVNHQLGPQNNHIIFVVEEAIEDAIEVGADCFTVDGRFPSLGIMGYENKDTSYIGRVLPYRDIPPVLLEVNAALAPVFKSFGARTPFSTEVRLTKDGVGYLIDLATRNGSPPSECIFETFSNWPDILGFGAQGVMIAPEPAGNYCAQVILRSTWAEDGFLAVRFPEKFRDSVKLHGHGIVDGTDFVTSIGIDIIGSTVGVGNTMAEATEKALEVAGSVEGQEITYDKHCFEPLYAQIDEGRRRGIDWPRT